MKIKTKSYILFRSNLVCCIRKRHGKLTGNIYVETEKKPVHKKKWRFDWKEPWLKCIYYGYEYYHEELC